MHMHVVLSAAHVLVLHIGAVSSSRYSLIVPDKQSCNNKMQYQPGHRCWVYGVGTSLFKAVSISSKTKCCPLPRQKQPLQTHCCRQPAAPLRKGIILCSPPCAASQASSCTVNVLPTQRCRRLQRVTCEKCMSTWLSVPGSKWHTGNKHGHITLGVPPAATEDSKIGYFRIAFITLTAEWLSTATR